MSPAPPRQRAARETEWARRKRREAERAAHVAEHGPACELCGNVPKRGLDEDHDHHTGQHRGWLCHKCNRTLWPGVTASQAYKLYVYLVRHEHRLRDAKERERVEKMLA